jgi:hypothetical protein
MAAVFNPTLIPTMMKHEGKSPSIKMEKLFYRTLTNKFMQTLNQE